MKEKEKQEFVAKQRERLFLMNTDELRKVNVDYQELKTAHERNLQIIEKQQNQEDDYNGTNHNTKIIKRGNYLCQIVLNGTQE